MKKHKWFAVISAMVMAFAVAGCQIDSDRHEHSFSKDWTSDATDHWHAATCEHTKEVSGKAAHTFGEWKTTVEATEETEGKKEHSCSVCSYKEEQSLAKLNHTHKFSSDWTSDATDHWHAATCEHTKEVSGKTAHTFGEWKTTVEATEEAEGKKERVCSVCSYKEETNIAKLGHTHKFSENWTSDSIYHWHVAICGHAEEVSDKAAHTFGDYVSNNDATTESDGTKTRKCSVCGYEDTVTDEGSKIVATPIFSIESGAVDSGTSVTITCGTEGAKIYYTTDGSEPTASSAEYTAAISVTPPMTLKAIAVKDGMNDSAVASASYTIKPDYSKCVVGDFVLKDGTILSKDETPESGTVAAVIVRAATNDKPALGVGIVHNRSGLAWCTTSAAGYNTNITALQGDKTSGYMDGSDGWEILKAACSDAENNPENYPAWNYSLTYAETNGLTGDLATGWYLPTVAELYTIYQNKTAVDASLSKAGGSQFGTSYYWSCCQCPSSYYIARVLCFDDGDMYDNSKGNGFSYVCSVRAFN